MTCIHQQSTAICAVALLGAALNQTAAAGPLIGVFPEHHTSLAVGARNNVVFSESQRSTDFATQVSQTFAFSGTQEALLQSNAGSINGPGTVALFFKPDTAFFSSGVPSPGASDNIQFMNSFLTMGVPQLQPHENLHSIPVAVSFNVDVFVAPGDTVGIGVAGSVDPNCTCPLPKAVGFGANEVFTEPGHYTVTVSNSGRVRQEIFGLSYTMDASFRVSISHSDPANSLTASSATSTSTASSVRLNWGGVGTFTEDVSGDEFGALLREQTGVNTVPEPSSLALCALGSLTICGAGWRRRRTVHCDS